MGQRTEQEAKQAMRQETDRQGSNMHCDDTIIDAVWLWPARYGQVQAMPRLACTTGVSIDN